MSLSQTALKKSSSAVDFSSTARSVTPSQTHGHQGLSNIVNEMVGLLWSDQQLADAYNGKKKDWCPKVAEALSIDTLLLRRAISHVGAEKVEALVNRNPAGEAPVVHGAVRMQSQMNQTYGCGTNASCQQTSGPCGTSTCGSCFCQSGSCVTPNGQMLKPKP